MKWFRSKSSAAKDGTSGEADAAQAGGGRRPSESTAQASTPKAKPANKFFAKRAAPRGRLGLRWEPIGSAQPAVGEQIVHPTLAETLRWKTEFTPDELDAFELPDLFEDSYVKTGEPGSKLKPVKYFKPIPPRTFLQGMKHMTEVNGKEVRVIERFGKKARVHVVETSAEFIVDTKHVRWADKTRWDGKQDDSSKSFIQREHAKEEMKLAREREGADNLESEWKAAKGTSISEQSGGDHADSADDEADPPRPLCRVEIGKRTALIKGDVDIELTFNKIMAAIPDLRRFKRFVLKEIATAVNYDETRCIFVYTKWDVEPPDDDHASLSTNYVIMRVRILQSSHLQHINAHHPRRIRSAPDIFEALWNQFQDEESILLRGLECSHLLSIRLLIDPYTAEGKEELKCAGLKREHCEGRHRKPVTKFNTTAEACKLFDEKQQLSIAAAAAHAKDQVDHARAALEEDVQAALEDGIITQEEQEVLEQKQAVLKAAEQMHAMLDGAKQIHTEAARDAEKALSNFQQVKTKKHEHALELNGIISEFEHRKAQEEETQEKVGSKLNALITDLETHQETEGKRKEADLLDQMLAEIEAMKIKSAAEKNGRRPGMEEEEEEEENLSEDCSRRSLSGTSLSGTTGSIQSIAQSDLLKLDNRPADLDALIAEMEEQTGQNSFSCRQHDSDSGPVAALYRTRYTIMAPAHLRSRAGNVSHVQAADMWVDHDSHEPEPKYKATSKPKYKMSWV